MQPSFLTDPYLEWVAREGVPVHEGFAVNLLQLETAPWPRLDARGAFVHLTARGDWLTCYLVDIPPGGVTAPQQHLFEEVFYVLDGRGSATVETFGGGRHTFEWGNGSMFTAPLNARYRLFNGSGQQPARIACVASLPLAMNAFHDEAFLFQNDFAFADRVGDERYFRGEGDFTPVRPGKHMWDTNFVPDLRAFRLHEWKERGAGGSSLQIILADGVMHAHVSEMPVGTYKKAHRHGPDFHIFPVTGYGYSLLWYEGDQEFTRVDWEHGWLYAPPEMMFHQHFNAGPDRSRYLAIAYGSVRYPFTADRRAKYLGSDVSQEEGGFQIEYEHEDPRIRQLFEVELARNGVECRMPAVLPGSRVGK
jgi:mannose-6-phosphate isomerase-like protein (cupin superfamily)